MSAEPLGIYDRLEETERLKRLGDEICADISEILEQRGEIALRYALLETIDDQVFALWHPFSEVANTARLEFVDAVIAKLRK